MKWILKLLLGLLLVSSVFFPLYGDADYHAIGTKAPEWNLDNWLNSEPRRLGDFAGHVVLVRWWTGPSCPFCTASAPALNEWYSRFREDGFTVIGIYHHKSKSPLRTEHIRVYAENLGFEFPVAVDHDWKTLRRWWMASNKEAKWTSVSFLIDRHGIIRYIHPGGQYVKSDEDYARIESSIEELLAESP
jgi:peroxiredoxin